MQKIGLLGLLVVVLGLGGVACGNDDDPTPSNENPCVGEACGEEPCVGEECVEDPVGEDPVGEDPEGEDPVGEDPVEKDLCEREPASDACVQCQFDLVVCKAMECSTEPAETLRACLEAHCSEYSDCFSFYND